MKKQIIALDKVYEDIVFGEDDNEDKYTVEQERIWCIALNTLQTAIYWFKILNDRVILDEVVEREIDNTDS